MKYKLARVLLLLACLLMVLFIGILIGRNLGSGKDKGVQTASGKNLDPVIGNRPDYKTWYAPESEEGALIYENYWAYVRTSYMIVGQIPDCRLYKIAPGAPRNDYVKSQFYADEGDNFKSYHAADGTKVSTICVDLSAYQTDIDYKALADAGVTMAILRIGYRGYGSGKIVDDEMFETHYEGLREAGIKVGVYFFSQAVNPAEGTEEANYVLAHIAGKTIEGPVVMDVELVADDAARTAQMTPEERSAAIVAFCERVRESGHTAMIYSNRNYFAECLDMTQICNYPMWLANYAEQPDFPYMYSGWQYTDQGRVPGINVDLDLNVWLE